MLLPYTGERSSLSAIPTGEEGVPLQEVNRIIQAGAEGDVQMAQAV
tara:strand:- start:451 stop:588 length:138 start_codon:yes stop_codon:yes gene_type:complete